MRNCQLDFVTDIYLLSKRISTYHLSNGISNILVNFSFQTYKIYKLHKSFSGSSTFFCVIIAP